MTPVKCVVWDLDGTVWPGVAIESVDPRPAPFPEALRAMAVLEQRGVVNSVASRTDPVVREVLRAHPQLGDRFVAPQLGWGHKSDMIRSIADELGIGVSAVALVDDNPFERAEVSAVLPEVRVLAPTELYAQLDTPLFRPAVLTEDASRRVERYRQEQRRAEAAHAFAGTTEDFLRGCDIRLRVAEAGPADVDRLAELIDRTHRFNTTGEFWDADQVRHMIADPAWFVPVARLTDRYGDYGLIGTALVRLGSPQRTAAWHLRLFTVSCRAAGRNVPTALLGWLVRRARESGADELLVDIRPSDANLELRVLLRGAGFAADAGAGAGAAPVGTAGPERTAAQQGTAGPAGTLLLRRGTRDDLPPVPWLTIDEVGRGND